MTRFLKIIAILGIAAALGFGGWYMLQSKQVPQASVPVHQQVEKKTQTQPSAEPEKAKRQPGSLSFLAVGDNIIHNTVYRAAKTRSGYDFSAMYAPVKELISAADLAFVNQEAPMGGKDYSPSSYPTFNCPQEIGRDLLKTGFNVVNLANNHMMDKGSGAIDDTIAYWKQHPEALTFGVYESAEDKAVLRTVTKNNIKVGFLGYTYGTNGIPLPKDKPYLVSVIDRDAITREVTAARAQCDVLIVSMHWGVEYQTKENAEQEELAQLLADLGVDVVVGTHPHVIQPAEWLTGKNGRKTFVAYSLGNFLSSQNKPMTMLGGMLRFTINMDKNGTVTIEKPIITPLVTYYRKDTYRVYPIYNYTDKLAASHAVRSKGDVSPSALSKRAKEIFGEFYTYGK